MVARGVALAAVVLVAAGCGGRTYSVAEAERTLPHGQPLAGSSGPQAFTTIEAVADLELDAQVGFAQAWVDYDMQVIRYRTPHDAWADQYFYGDPATDASEGVVTVRRGNLLFNGPRAAVAAALRRLR